METGNSGSKKMFWTGAVISALVSLMFLFGGIMAVARPPQVLEGMAKFGYPQHLALVLGIVEIGCTIIYLIPRTAVLGAVLLTGYLGGATATHARMEDWAFIFPILFGVLVWLGVYLRDARVRALLPLRA